MYKWVFTECPAKRFYPSTQTCIECVYKRVESLRHESTSTSTWV